MCSNPRLLCRSCCGTPHNGSRRASIITDGTGRTHNYDVVAELQTFHNRNATVSGLEGESHHTSIINLSLITYLPPDWKKRDEIDVFQSIYHKSRPPSLNGERLGTRRSAESGMLCW
ncbi:hypothetical protein CY34DRAFT_809488 [Suillus luteus UH-Slu-Lm8-n1]|uniref:Uncharacterized protein n=1 Tax=Suillus luteus UH-Slu-Lm8-n1 TaxID=930992 RepID=A0A0D0A975_9AGAM|nr:hypothetical protein CY34DRAFT_809488 [Suillus luteus UH-Slu-Lm8-n1]